MLWGYGTFLVISVSEDESDDFELLLINSFTTKNKSCSKLKYMDI